MTVDFHGVDWRAIKARSCTGKTQLPNHAAARTVAAKAAAKAGETIRAYQCLFCPDWHVGHVPSMDSLELLAAAKRAMDNDNDQENA